MPKIQLTKDALTALTPEKKQKLKAKIASGELELEIINTPTPSQKPKSPKELFANIDVSSLPDGKVGIDGKPIPKAPDLSKAVEHKEPSFWDKTKNFFKKAVPQALEPLNEGSQNVIDAFSPIDIKVSQHGGLDEAIDNSAYAKNAKDTTAYKVYDYLGKLSNTDQSFKKLIDGKADPEDIKTYEKNRNHLLLDVLGYDEVGQDKDGTTWIHKGDKWSKLDKDGIKATLGSILGDKGEVIGALIGAKKGYDFAKVGGKKAKLLSSLVGGALGAAGGNALDQLNSYLQTGEELSLKQRLAEMGKSAAIEAGAGVAGAGAVEAGAMALKLGGKAIALPKTAIKAIYRHILDGNIDGAKKILKKDLGVSDEEMSEALKQMQTMQKEQYVKNENAIKKAVDTLGEGKDLNSAKEALKGLSDDALDSLGDAKTKEEFIATLMQHPQGEQILKEAISSNPKAAIEVEKSIDARARNFLGLKDNALPGTDIKKEIENYKQDVHDHFSDMRDNFKQAFGNSKYKFNLDSLGLHKEIDSLSKRVTDPYVKERFTTMADAIDNITKGGITKDINDLLDIRQQLNAFYRKNEKALPLKTDKATFRAMLQNVDNEIKKAVKEHLPQDLGQKLLKDFSESRARYKDMHALENNSLYKAIMSDGKSSSDRLNALLKHADDDAGELQQVLEKLPKDKATAVEHTIVDNIINKNIVGNPNKMVAIDYNKALEQLKSVEPFLTTPEAKQTISLMEQTNKLFKHDLELSKYVKGVSEDSPSGGIATTLHGRIKTNIVSRLYDIYSTLVPYGEKPKRLALYKHVASALKKSRTPQELALKVSKIKDIPTDKRRELKELVKDYAKAAKVKTEQEAKQLAKQIEAKEAQKLQEQKAKQEAIKNFTTPPIEELQVVENLAPDDKAYTLHRAIAQIQKGTPSSADIERYLKAKASLGEERITPRVEKLKFKKAKAKYSNIPKEEIEQLERVRDYMLSHNTGFGQELNGRAFKKLIYDLKNGGITKPNQPELIEKLKGLYNEFEQDIKSQYGNKSDLDNINPDDIF